MSKPEIIEKKPLSVAELKSILKDLKKRDGELSFRANKTEEYTNHVATISKTKVLELQKKLLDLSVPRLKDEHVTKIADVLPKSVAELKIVLQGYTLTVSNDNLTKIIGVVKDYLPGK